MVSSAHLDSPARDFPDRRPPPSSRLRKVKCDPIPDTRQCESCQAGGFVCTFQERTRRQIEGLDVLDVTEKPAMSKARSAPVAPSLLTNSLKQRPSSRPRMTPRPHSQLQVIFSPFSSFWHPLISLPASPARLSRSPPPPPVTSAFPLFPFPPLLRSPFPPHLPVDPH